jgi:uncharacterized lipoprotein YmbA
MTLRPLLMTVCAGLVLLAGCSSAPATRFYTLAAVAEVPPASTKGPAPHATRPVTLVITDLRLPQYLDRPQIVTRGSDHRLRMTEHQQWGGNLRDDMTRVLAGNLGRQLPGDRVLAAPTHIALQPDCRIEVDVQRFEREANGSVKLAARWWITRGSDGTLLASAEASFTGAPVGEDDYEMLVGAMSAVFGDLAQAIADSIRARAAGGS